MAALCYKRRERSLIHHSGLTTTKDYVLAMTTAGVECTVIFHVT